MEILRGMKNFLAGLFCAALLFVASVVAGGDDKDAREHDAIRGALQRGEVLPLAKILAIAQEKVPGDVIEVELETEHKVLIYEIKVLTQSGRVREIKIDARTGAVLTVEDD
ncbi:MAG TPA: PepSY domain-containing protein [Steroidobacteraceae bacterium]|nr:PepSY domain-containing protein [Steroidobacteraceae bacterium]